MNNLYVISTADEIGLRFFRDGQVTCEVPENRNHVPHTLKARISSYGDLFTIASIIDAYRTWVPNALTDLEICYLIGSRSDRRFSKVGSFDLKHVTKFINDLNFQRVRLFEPHSDVAVALIDRCQAVPFMWWNNIAKDDVIISPDAGAYKRLSGQMEQFDIQNRLVSAVKHRDASNTPKVILTDPEAVVGADCHIIDDLCDGGRTFTSLAEKLYDAGAASVRLSVAHGLFTNGFDPLFNAKIRHIYTTNSYQDFPFIEEVPSVTVQKVF